MSLSVLSSVQCCIVISGVGEPDRTTFISHRPALRIGISTARASSAGSSVERPTAKQIETNSRVMLRAPGYSVRIDGGVAGSVLGAQRPFGGAIRHPAAGE